MDSKACSIIAWREDGRKEHRGLPGVQDTKGLLLWFT